MKNTVSSMIVMKPKDAIKLDSVPPDKTLYYNIQYPLYYNIQKKLYCRRMDYVDTFINLTNNMETKKDGQQTLSGVTIRIDQIELYSLVLFAGRT